MPLVHKLVTAYGGTIAVESREQVEGSTDHGTEVRIVLRAAGSTGP
jgi:signal transduction histidine kinase